MIFFYINSVQMSLLYILFIYLFIYLAALGLRCCEQGLLLVAVHRLLLAVASLVVEHGL